MRARAYEGEKERISGNIARIRDMYVIQSMNQRNAKSEFLLTDAEFLIVESNLRDA